MKNDNKSLVWAIAPTSKLAETDVYFAILRKRALRRIKLMMFGAKLEVHRLGLTFVSN